MAAMKLVMIPLAALVIFAGPSQAASLQNDPLVELFQRLHSLAISPHPDLQYEQFDELKELLPALTEHGDFSDLLVDREEHLTGGSLDHLHELSRAFLNEGEVQTLSRIYPEILRRWMVNDRSFARAINDANRSEIKKRIRRIESYVIGGGALLWAAIVAPEWAAPVPAVLAAPIILYRHWPVKAQSKREQIVAFRLRTYLQNEWEDCEANLINQEIIEVERSKAPDSKESDV